MKTIHLYYKYFAALVLSVSCCLLAGCSDDDPGIEPTIYEVPVFSVSPGDRHTSSKTDEATTVVIDTWREYTFAVVPEYPENLEDLKVFVEDAYLSKFSYVMEDGLLYITVSDNFEMSAVESRIILANGHDAAYRTTINVTQPRMKLGIEYFSQGNVRGYSSYSFVEPTKVGYYYTWIYAFNEFGGGYVIEDKVWHLPSIAEWVALFPEKTSYITFTGKSQDSIGKENEIATVAGCTFEGLCDYRSKSSDLATYAIRFKGSDIESAYRYQYLKNYTDENGDIYYKFVVTVRKLDKNSGLTLDDVGNVEYWENNNSGDISITLPAAGYNDGISGYFATHGTAYFWTSEYNTTPNFPWLFYMNHSLAGMGMQFDSAVAERSVRLVYNE